MLYLWGFMTKVFFCALIMLTGIAPPALAQKLHDQPDWNRCIGAGFIASSVSVADAAACNRLLKSFKMTPTERARVLELRGDREEYEKNYAAAIASYSEALDLADILSEQRRLLLLGRAHILAKTDDKVAARRDYSAAATIKPGVANIFRGRLAFSERRFADATADAEAVLALPDAEKSWRAAAYGLRGQVRQTAKDFGGAVEDYTSQIRLEPTAEVALRRGAAYRDAGLYSKAEADFLVVARQVPRLATAWNELCWLHAAHMRDDFDLAASYCEEALKLEKDNPGYLDSWGLVLLHRRQWQQAWAAYDSVIAKSSALQASGYYGRGLAALKLGKSSQGRADIAKANLLSPNIAADYASYGQNP